jgi:hypothetical protein
MPAKYIGGKVPKLIVRDVFWNISRCSSAKTILLQMGLDPAPSCVRGEYRCHWTIKLLINWNKKGRSKSADNLPDKSWNLSSYIMECGSSEKFELLLEKCQLKLRITFLRNMFCNIFMK